MNTKTFTQCLMGCTKKELVALFKTHHLSGYSSLKKDEMAARLSQYLLQTETIRHLFLYFGDDELHLYQTIEQKGSVSARLKPLLQKFCAAGYCFPQKNGTFCIPSEMCKRIPKDRNFENQRKQVSFFFDCLNAAGLLYGCAPISKIIDLYQAHMSDTMTTQTAISLIGNAPSFFIPFRVENNLVIHPSLCANNLYLRIQQCQASSPYYIPSRQEILHLSRYGYFPEDEHTKNLSSALMDYTGFSQEECVELTGEIQAVFRQGGTIQDAREFLEKNYHLSPSLEEKKLFASLNEVFAHTRLLLHRGYTTAELEKSVPSKIYPNSPCPCGSGKKYKKCCGCHR